MSRATEGSGKVVVASSAMEDGAVVLGRSRGASSSALAFSSCGDKDSDGGGRVGGQRLQITHITRLVLIRTSNKLCAQHASR